MNAEDLVNIFVLIGLEEKSLNPINLLTSAERKQMGENIKNRKYFINYLFN
jgi:hypothetical protein